MLTILNFSGVNLFHLRARTTEPNKKREIMETDACKWDDKFEEKKKMSK